MDTTDKKDTRKKLTTKTTPALTKKSRGRTETKADESGARELPLAWKATEPHTRHRWWWYPVVGYLGLFLALIAGAKNEWITMTAILTATLALLVIASQKPRTYLYLLTTKAITIDDEKNPAKDYDFTRYKYFTIDITEPTKKQPEQYTIALLPKKRFAPALEIYLPQNPQDALAIVETFQTVLAYNDAPSYNSTQRILRAIGKTLRLN